MQENFDKAMEFILKWEGWHSDDPDDAGGKTVWGITERDYPEEFPALWNMGKEESKEYVKKFYKKDYWDKVGGDGLSKSVDIIIFDTAVNMGTTFANKLKGYDMNTALMERIKRYTEIAAIGNNIKFLRGWIRRVIDLYYFVKLI